MLFDTDVDRGGRSVIPAALHRNSDGRVLSMFHRCSTPPSPTGSRAGKVRRANFLSAIAPVSAFLFALVAISPPLQSHSFTRSGTATGSSCHMAQLNARAAAGRNAGIHQKYCWDGHRWIGHVQTNRSVGACGRRCTARTRGGCVQTARRCTKTATRCVQSKRRCTKRARRCVQSKRRCVKYTRVCVRRGRSCIRRVNGRCVQYGTRCVQRVNRCVRTKTRCVRRETRCVRAKTYCVRKANRCVRSTTYCVRRGGPRCVRWQYRANWSARWRDQWHAC